MSYGSIFGTILAQYVSMRNIIRFSTTFYWLKALLLGFYVASASLCFAQAEAHPGYTFDVKSEREMRPVEISVVEEPKEVVKTDYQKLIFTEKLTEEFKVKYKEKFGHTQAEIQLNPANKYAMTQYSASIVYTAEEARYENQLFGEYMFRRLVEFHVDQYFKGNPTMRKVYEVKDRISNVDMEVKQGYKLKLNYNLADNSVNVSLENPYKLENKFVIQMDPKAFWFSDVHERIIFVRYQFDKVHSLASNYKIVDGIISVIGERKVSPALTTNITGQTFVHEEGESIRDNRLIVGFTYSP